MALLFASLVLLASGGTTDGGTPTLRIEKSHPLVVSGTGFGATERITLRISGGNPPRTVAADANGAFRVQLGSFRTIRCAALVVVAAGADGHTASAHLPRTTCPSPPGSDATK